MNILFIDDDRDDVELFCEIIHEIDPHALCNSIASCEDLEQQISQLSQPDVIFLDAHMNPVNGKNCLDRVKQLVDLRKTKVIIHTGSISKQEEDEFLGMGVTGILYKAASYQEIKANLSHAIMREDKQSA